MADTASMPPTPVKITPDIPLIFADGVISQVYGPGVSKFYFGRFDADPHAEGPGASVPVAQLVMPTEGFADMVSFLEFRLQTMIEAGVISADYVARSRAKWSKA